MDMHVHMHTKPSLDHQGIQALHQGLPALIPSISTNLCSYNDNQSPGIRSIASSPNREGLYQLYRQLESVQPIEL